MNCAQSGCEITPDSLMEAGSIPRLCPTCGHPLRIVVSVEELAEMSGVPAEDEPAEDGGGLLGDETN